jgi:hypothetical protein
MMLTNVKLEQCAHQTKSGVLQEDIIFNKVQQYGFIDNKTSLHYHYKCKEDYWMSSSNRIKIEPSQFIS